jgi:hypothetical protein
MKAKVVGIPAKFESQVEVGDYVFHHHHVALNDNQIVDVNEKIYRVNYDPFGGRAIQAYLIEKPDGSFDSCCGLGVPRASRASSLNSRAMFWNYLRLRSQKSVGDVSCTEVSGWSQKDLLLVMWYSSLKMQTTRWTSMAASCGVCKSTTCYA